MTENIILLHFPNNKNYQVGSTSPQIIVGRASTCDLCLQYYFDDPISVISSRHFKIHYREDRGFFITDLHSRNGTYLNGKALTPDEGVYLRDGDEIKITQDIKYLIKVKSISDSATAVLYNSPQISEMLTLRHREVLKLLADGLSQEQVAKELSLATETVKTHLKIIREKLGVKTTIQAVAYAKEKGWI